MNKFWSIFIFRKNKKPRAWTSSLVFKKNGQVRRPFNRIVYKKSGALRPQFMPWINVLSEKYVKSTGGGIGHTGDDFHAPLSDAEIVLKNLKPFAATTEDWTRRQRQPASLSCPEIIMHLQFRDSAELILSVSHDNYRESLGGVQFCLQREEKIARDRGMLYVQIHPWQALPHLVDCKLAKDYLVSINCDGALIGTTSISILIEAVAELVKKGRKARVIVHHLLGHAPEAICRLVQATDDSTPLFWIHDFFSLCPSVTLQRNTLSFCAAPPPNSNACLLCVFGSSRSDHQARIATFFQTTLPVAVAPSQVTADFWLSKVDLKHKSIVIVPHIRLEEVTRRGSVPTIEKIRIGHLGVAATHKGWPTYTKLIYELSDLNVEFVVLSNKRPNVGEDYWENVSVSAEEPDAMVKAVKRQNLDFVLHWASCFETFSFTTFEAISGGAYVLTNEASGNVRATIESNGKGEVFKDVQDLLAFFRDGSATYLAQQRRKTVATTSLEIVHSDLSFAVLDRT